MNQHLGWNLSAASRSARARAPKWVRVHEWGGGRVQKEGLCEGEDGEAREAFPLAVEGQRRENGFERIIKAGKRGWELRRGVWGGGFTRPGSYCTDLSVFGLTDRELLQPCSQKVHVVEPFGPLFAQLIAHP